MMVNHDFQYYVHCNAGGSVFVKGATFFESQGGKTESWGKHWIPVFANSIEEARAFGCYLFDDARPYREQAPPDDPQSCLDRERVLEFLDSLHCQGFKGKPYCENGSCATCKSGEPCH